MKHISNIFLTTLSVLIAILVGCKEVDETQKADEYYNERSDSFFSKGPENPSVIINNNDATTDSLQVTLTLSATDNVGVTGYYTSESSTKPSINDSGWNVVNPVVSNFQLSTTKNLIGGSATIFVYAWFRDSEGNISDASNDAIEIIPGFKISSISGNTSEIGVTATFTVRLITRPNGNVVIDVTSQDTTEGTVSPASLTFTPTNWNANQTVTVTGVGDSLNDGDQTYTIELTINTTNTTDTTGYASLNPDDVSVTNLEFVWKLSDTGQTTSYTSTFGEDADYLINPPSFTNNGNGTVTDNNTGLIWQREDDNNTRTWADAGTYCSNLVLGGYSDWRLPSDWELISIVNYGTYSPAIDSSAFPNTNSSYYWSSTTYASNTGNAWYVYFPNGYVDSYSKTYSYYVRCVRGSQ